METTLSCTDFDNFAALSEWMAGLFQWTILRNYSFRSLPHAKSPALMLLLHLRHSNSDLAGMRINILSLIRLIYSLTINTIVRVSVGPKNATGRMTEAYEIKLQTLRRGCFILLSAAMLQKPDVAKLPAPEIWINDLGALI